MSFVVHKSVLPPTGADACVSCFFTPNSSNTTKDDDDENDEEYDRNNGESIL